MTTEIVVVGAGIAGAAAAAALAARRPGDGRVVLLEREPLPAQHASGRSASVLSETSGHPVVCALARLSRPWFEQPPPGCTDHPLLSPRGLLWVGEADDVDALDQLAEQGRRIRPSVTRLDPAATSRLLPTFRPHAIAGGGVHEPEAMAIDTAATIDGLLRRFRGHGGRVELAHEAVELHRMPHGSWTVHAGPLRLHAEHVVNAAGAWADELAVRAGLAPLGLQAMRRTAAISPTSDDLSGWPLVMDIAGRYYCEPEPGGLLVSPADETPSEPCDAQPDELDVALALERVADASGLPLRAIRRAWAGLRTFTPDRVPVLGADPSAPGLWWLAGQGGAGIKTAPAMATLLTALLHDEPFPDEARMLGLSPEQLAPARLR